MIKTLITQKFIASVVGIIIAIALFLSPIKKIPFLDEKTSSYFKEAVVKAGVAYGTCRAINASVSLIKESDLQFEPAGIGVSIAAGQILDPIDDMTERVSTVLVTAITSLSVQKLAYEICVELAPQVFSVFLVIFSIVILFKNDRFMFLQKLTIRILILVTVLRCCLPLSSIANDFLYKNFFDGKITEAKQKLSLHANTPANLEEIVDPESTGLWTTIGNSTSFIKKSIDFRDTLGNYKTNMEDIIKNLLELTALYVGIFLIQVIGLPIIAFWILIRFANTLFNTNSPVILQHSRISKNKEIK